MAAYPESNSRTYRDQLKRTSHLHGLTQDLVEGVKGLIERIGPDIAVTSLQLNFITSETQLPEKRCKEEEKELQTKAKTDTSTPPMESKVKSPEKVSPEEKPSQKTPKKHSKGPRVKKRCLVHGVTDGSVSVPSEKVAVAEEPKGVRGKTYTGSLVDMAFVLARVFASDKVRFPDEEEDDDKCIAEIYKLSETSTFKDILNALQDERKCERLQNKEDCRDGCVGKCPNFAACNMQALPCIDLPTPDITHLMQRPPDYKPKPNILHNKTTLTIPHHICVPRSEKKNSVGPSTASLFTRNRCKCRFSKEGSESKQHQLGRS